MRQMRPRVLIVGGDHRVGIAAWPDWAAIEHAPADRGRDRKGRLDQEDGPRGR